MNPDDPNAFDIQNDPNDRARAIFSMRPRLDGQKSKEAGRPVHVNRPYVEIIIPGSKDRKEGWVNDAHKRRFAAQWREFEARGQKQDVEGTMLESWPIMDRATVADLNALNIRTVEDVAGLDDSALQKIGPGARKLKQQAEMYLEAAAGGAPLERLQQENKNLSGRVETLSQQVEELQQALAASQKSDEQASRRGPGRPRKNEAA